MYVMTKEQAQEWLNRPEHYQIVELECREKNDYVVITTQTGERYTFPMSVDSNAIITRKKPWHWPKPDENTPIDARVWYFTHGHWYRGHYAGDDRVYSSGDSSWTSSGATWVFKFIVLANPDDLDEVPPMDFGV